MLLLAVPAVSLLAGAQSLADSGASSSAVAITTPVYPGLAYIRPTAEMKLHSYFFDVLGPYPIAGTTLVAGINQADNTPPEWKQGVDMLYVQRLLADGSDVQFIVAPRPARQGGSPTADASSAALHVHTSIAGHQATFLLARDHGDWVGGVGVNGALGGSTWNVFTKLAGPMQLGWLPNSQNGLMVGDYIATAFTSGVPHGVFAVARTKSGTKFNEAMNTAQGLTVPEAGPQMSSAGDKPLHKLSDVIEKEKPEKGVVPPSKRAVKRSSK